LRTDGVREQEHRNISKLEPPFSLIRS
jgi:hypothetical protein